ncbi:MAG: protein BatD [Sinobacteraceae bacterium]|nr:protein BatD [Nevskiaceae bacterium]
MKRLCALCILFAGLVGAVTADAAIEVEVSPEPVVADESCRITFRAEDVDVGEPDFAPLEDDFEILGRNRQSSLNWVNGRRSQSTTWVLDAMPRHAGTLTIPAIRFGQETSPARSVEVVASAPAQNTAGDADIILEAEATPHDPYVQQQVIYTVRLLHRVELSSPRFSPLETSSDAVIKPLGDGRQYRTKVNGVSYDAFEQRYAIFPQKSGAMTISPLALTTQIVRGVRSLFDPFSQALQTRRVQSEAVELEVRPVPAAFPAGATWLPARRLRLHEEWDPDAPRAETGTPIARTLFLWADGLVAGQLPAVAPGTPAGTKLYPDQAQSNEQDTATGFTAVRQQKFAIIASQPGRVTFAALSLPWWNTETDTLEHAELPARTIEFSGAATSPATPAPPASESAAPAAAPGAEDTPAPRLAPTTPPLTWVATSAVFAVLWLVTLFAWWRARGRPPAAGQPTPARPTSPRCARRVPPARSSRPALPTTPRPPATRCSLGARPAARAIAAACATSSHGSKPRPSPMPCSPSSARCTAVTPKRGVAPRCGRPSASNHADGHGRRTTTRPRRRYRRWPS